MKKKNATCKLILRAVTLVAKSAPIYSLVFVICFLLSGLISGVSAPVYQKLYDAIERLTFKQERIAHVVLCACLVVAVIIAEQLINVINSILSESFRHITSLKLETMMNKKISRLPLVSFEDKKTLDDIEKANSGLYGLMDLFMACIRIMFFYLAYFAIIGRYLWGIKPILLLTLFLIFVPVAITQVMQTRIYTNEESELAPLRRMEDSFYFHAMDVRETRLFGAFHHFHQLRKNVVASMHQKQWRNQKRLTRITLILNGIKILGWIGIIALLFHALAKKEISIGGFAAVFASISAVFGHMEGFFGVIKRNITNKFGMIANFIKLMDMPEEIGISASLDFRCGIVAEHVSFAYPNQETLAVRDVSLTIHEGETVALVGENGSGKTTLAKLLLGLYKPTAGTVSIGGGDTATTLEQDLFSQTSAVFQDFKNYGNLTLSDNIRIGDFRHDCDVSGLLSDFEVHVADEKTFPSGLDTIMSREFGGIDISKGQWQRIAMARGMYRNHNFIILDEPTASIDPLEETLVYRHFADMAKNCTVLLITHRLGSARIADKIVVMDHGAIVEYGTHDWLLAHHGKYAAMWELQASGYQPS